MAKQSLDALGADAKQVVETFNAMNLHLQVTGGFGRYTAEPVETTYILGASYIVEHGSIGGRMFLASAETPDEAVLALMDQFRESAQKDERVVVERNPFQILTHKFPSFEVFKYEEAGDRGVREGYLTAVLKFQPD